MKTLFVVLGDMVSSREVGNIIEMHDVLVHAIETVNRYYSRDFYAPMKILAMS